MSASKKRDNTLKQKLLALVRQFPGTLTGNIPPAQRRFLKELEKAGLLESRPEGNEFRWYAAEVCCLCGKPLDDPHGHNPAPIARAGRCCTACHETKVLPERFRQAATGGQEGGGE